MNKFFDNKLCWFLYGAVKAATFELYIVLFFVGITVSMNGDSVFDVINNIFLDIKNFPSALFPVFIVCILPLLIGGFAEMLVFQNLKYNRYKSIEKKLENIEKMLGEKNGN